MMKRLMIVAVVLGLLATNLQAQGIGIRGGLNAATEYRVDDADPSGYLISPRLGLFIQQPLAGNVYIRPEMMFTGKGYSNEETVLGTSINSYANPNYLEIPLLFGVKSNTGPVKVYAEGGPFAAVAVGGRYQTDAGPFEDSGQLDFGEGADDDYSNSDYGLVFGAGLEFANSIEVGLNYDLGLKDVRPANQSGDGIYTRAIALTGALKF